MNKSKMDKYSHLDYPIRFNTMLSVLFFVKSTTNPTDILFLPNLVMNHRIIEKKIKSDALLINDL
jgi:hypothetical protein